MKNVNANTVNAWLMNTEAILVDVREPAEYEAAHIAGAHSVPLSALSCAALPEHEGKKLVIHCHKGGRGAMACQKLCGERPDMEVYHLEGGMQSWEAARLPVVRSGRKMLPLDRQVQLTVGVLLMLGSAFAYKVSAAFLLVTGIIGLGLTIAGATGFCGLALFLARMPWNKK